ncbi:C-C chemokine receptor type 8-like [Ambystoma mexicanum]|uniref:C-C chemokine receptor type 8-like n=1 Tax=Ambystoma mexicanum TaxID=8296 RepID=UPI0037E8677E
MSSGLETVLPMMDSTVDTSDQENVTEFDYPTEVACDKDSVRRFGAVYLPVLYSLVFVFGLLGNSLVLWVLITCKKMKSIPDMCLLNLAISDLLFVVCLPFQAHYAADQWVFGDAMCKLITAVYYIGFFSSIFFITLISLDRYLAVVHAVFALRVRTPTWGIIMSSVVWAVSTAASVPAFVFYREIWVDESLCCLPNYPSESEMAWELVTHFEINILGWLLPLSVLIYCNYHIIRNLQGSKSRQKVKACQLILVVVIVFFLFWTPYNAVVLLLTLQKWDLLDSCTMMKGLDQALQITVTISLIHCCLNPVIYAFVGEKFKKYLSDLGHKYFANVPMCRRFTAFAIFSLDRTSSEKTTSTYSAASNMVL